MLPSITSILFCFDFRNATPLLFCPPSLDKQKFKDLKTCRDKQDKLDKDDNQDGQQLLNSIKHNFTSDSSLAESCTNLFPPALKSTIKKYWTRPEFSQNTAVFNKGIIFLNDIRWPSIFLGTERSGFFIFIKVDLKK
jgi:hypothetical protein